MTEKTTEKKEYIIASPPDTGGRSNLRYSNSSSRWLRRFALCHDTLSETSQSAQDSFSYGGQAVIEGVMMRGKRMMAVAVRRPDGTIQTDIKPLGGIYQSRITKIPVLRGVLLLWDTLGLGWQGLEYSAQAQGEEPISRKEWIGTVLFALAILVGVFFLLPAAIGQGIESLLASSVTTANVTVNAASLAVETVGRNPALPAWLPAMAGNLTEGVIRLVLLILYLVLVGRIPEIARVFAYHGAEHKTVAAYEAGAALTPESAEKYPKEHPRCGTSFLIAVGVLAVILFSLAGSMPFGWKMLTRLLGIPVLVAFGYEYLRFSAAVKNKTLKRILAAPGIWTQSLTTREPDRPMLEVAITALEAVRRADNLPAEAIVEAASTAVEIPEPETETTYS
jgi:uncharacterized protein YqhQ